MIDKNMQKTPIVRDIDVLLFDQFSNHCLANAIEPIRAANSIAGAEIYRWRFVSLEGGMITSSSGMVVETEPLNSNSAQIALLLAMPSYGYRNMATPAFLAALRLADKRTTTMVGLDTGAWLFAAAGLLDGKRATIHAAVLEEFSESFLQVEVSKDRIVVDEKYVTCGGAMAAFDLALHLIGEQQGAMLKHEVESFFLYQDDSKESRNLQLNQRTSLVGQALKLMDDNLETPIPINQMSEFLDCSQKEMQRRFLRSLNMPPAQAYKHKRLSHAKTLLLSTDLAVTEIAVRSGYENASAMTRAFKDKFGLTPSAMRLSAFD